MLSKKRLFPFDNSIDEKSVTKKLKIDVERRTTIKSLNKMEHNDDKTDSAPSSLVEQLRPVHLNDFFGQSQVVGNGTVLRQLLERKRISSTILWGPPGCGKTSLANIIASISNDGPDKTVNFIKLSAITSGIPIIKDLVKTAMKERLNNHRRTIVFMSEIHRFNKLQQDIFLPHVESGTFILIGATRENPSYSLNSALLSRCRVYQLDKLTESDIKNILSRAIALSNLKTNTNDPTANQPSKYSIEPDCIEWLAKICDGNAKIGLNTLELAIQSPRSEQIDDSIIKSITLKDMRINFEKACNIIPDKKTDLNHDLVAAMHKSIRASEANAALYWLARLMATGEDPVYIGKRLIRIASEDVGILDSDVLDTAVHAMHGCQMIGMPECDVLLAQCVIYLSRAQKSIVNPNIQLI